MSSLQEGSTHFLSLQERSTRNSSTGDARIHLQGTHGFIYRGRADELFTGGVHALPLFTGEVHAEFIYRGRADSSTGDARIHLQGTRG